MSIDLKSPLGILKGVGVFIALAVVASLAVTAVAAGVDIALPGRGAQLKSFFPFR